MVESENRRETSLFGPLCCISKNTKHYDLYYIIIGSPEEGELAERWTSGGHPLDDDQIRAELLEPLEHALAHLYDPVELGQSLLVGWLQLDHQPRPAVALRRRLVDCIESLKPSADVPIDSNAWRYYQLLSQRYVARFAQSDIAMNLSISARQLRRLHPLALQSLADLLSREYGVSHRVSSRSSESVGQGNVLSPSRQDELDRLHRDQPSELIDFCKLVRSALGIMAGLAHDKAVEIECDLPEDVPHVAAQPTATLHALLNLLTVAVRHAGGGTIRVGVERKQDRLAITICPSPQPHRAPVVLSDQDHENIRAAEELIALSGGAVATTPSGVRGASAKFMLSLPAGERIGVLVIDDNVDSLQLYRRFLAGTRYRFTGVREPEEVIELAEKLCPRLVVLDLMLPGKDGWELLGQFRAHPKLRQVPLIVCTVLPQEDLAMALGAAGFIQKPVSRAGFLSALDAQIGVQAPQSPSHVR